jgi:MraZ protein
VEDKELNTPIEYEKVEDRANFKGDFKIGVGKAFYGSFKHSIDEKGRLSLPSEYREALFKQGDRSLFITNNLSLGERCLECWPATEWHNFRKKLLKKSRFSSKLQQFEHYYLSRAAEVALDNAGRILIPFNLRVYAAFEREITLSAALSFFRLWNTQIFETLHHKIESALHDQPNLFAELDLENE